MERLRWTETEVKMLRLFVDKGKSNSEIAELLGRSPNGVKDKNTRGFGSHLSIPSIACVQHVNVP